MREATSERRWLRWATRAAQVAFVPVAWWTWLCGAQRILHPSPWHMEPPRVELECAMACGCVALLWLIARRWRALQWPAVVTMVGSLAGPWFHFESFAWLDHRLAVPSAYFDAWASTPWQFVLPGAAARDGFSSQTQLLELAIGASVAALVGLASRLKIVRYSVFFALLAFAGHAWLTASIRAEARPSVEVWMRDFEEIERVPVMRISLGPSEYDGAPVRRLSDGTTVWRVRYSESEFTRGVELHFGRLEAMGLYNGDDGARLVCERGDELVVRRREFPRTSFAVCERDGVVRSGPVATRDPWFELRRINGMRHFALPTEWIEPAKTALWLALMALVAERCARRSLARRAAKRHSEARERREHPYREAPSERDARVTEKRGESAEALDQWAIVAMALHVIAPVIVGVLAEKNVPQW